MVCIPHWLCVQKQSEAIIGNEWVISMRDVYVNCEMQCLLSTIFYVSYLGFFIFSLNVFRIQKEEITSSTYYPSVTLEIFILIFEFIIF